MATTKDLSPASNANNSQENDEQGEKDCHSIVKSSGLGANKNACCEHTRLQVSNKTHRHHHHNSQGKVSVACQTDDGVSATGASDDANCSTHHESPRGIMIEDVTKTEGTLRLMITNFKNMTDTVRGPAKIVNGVPWKIMVMPRQHAVQKKGMQKCLGFFLQCCPDAYSDSWSCQAAAELRLISQRPGVMNFTRKTNHVYTAKENDWGYSCFMTWADILDESQGYIKDDRVILEVYVKAEPAKNVLTREAFQKKIQDYMRLADMQSSRGLIDKAIEVNQSALKFCKDKDEECRAELEKQKQKLIEMKLKESIERIEKGKQPGEGGVEGVGDDVTGSQTTVGTPGATSAGGSAGATTGASSTAANLHSANLNALRKALQTGDLAGLSKKGNGTGGQQKGSPPQPKKQQSAPTPVQKSAEKTVGGGGDGKAKKHDEASNKLPDLVPQQRAGGNEVVDLVSEDELGSDDNVDMGDGRGSKGGAGDGATKSKRGGRSTKTPTDAADSEGSSGMDDDDYCDDDDDDELCDTCLQERLEGMIINKVVPVTSESGCQTESDGIAPSQQTTDAHDGKKSKSMTPPTADKKETNKSAAALDVTAAFDAISELTAGLAPAKDKQEEEDFNIYVDHLFSLRGKGSSARAASEEEQTQMLKEELLIRGAGDGADIDLSTIVHDGDIVTRGAAAAAAAAGQQKWPPEKEQELLDLITQESRASLDSIRDTLERLVHLAQDGVDVPPGLEFDLQALRSAQEGFSSKAAAKELSGAADPTMDIIELPPPPASAVHQAAMFGGVVGAQLTKLHPDMDIVDLDEHGKVLETTKAANLIVRHQQLQMAANKAGDSQQQQNAMALAMQHQLQIASQLQQRQPADIAAVTVDQLNAATGFEYTDEEYALIAHAKQIVENKAEELVSKYSQLIEQSEATRLAETVKKVEKRMKDIEKQTMTCRKELADECERHHKEEQKLTKTNRALQSDLEKVNKKAETIGNQLKEKKTEIKRLEKRLKTEGQLAGENGQLTTRIEQLEKDLLASQKKQSEESKKHQRETQSMIDSKKHLQQELTSLEADNERLHNQLDEKASAMRKLEQKADAERKHANQMLKDALERAKKAETNLLEFKLEMGIKVLQRAQEECTTHVKQLDEMTKRCVGTQRNDDVQKCKSCMGEWLRTKEKITELISGSKAEFTGQMEAIRSGKPLAQLPVLEVSKPPPPPKMPQLTVDTPSTNSTTAVPVSTALPSAQQQQSFQAFDGQTVGKPNPVGTPGAPAAAPHIAPIGAPRPAVASQNVANGPTTPSSGYPTPIGGGSGSGAGESAGQQISQQTTTANGPSAMQQTVMAPINLPPVSTQTRVDGGNMMRTPPPGDTTALSNSGVGGGALTNGAFSPWSDPLNNLAETLLMSRQMNNVQQQASVSSQQQSNNVAGSHLASMFGGARPLSSSQQLPAPPSTHTMPPPSTAGGGWSDGWGTALVAGAYPGGLPPPQQQSASTSSSSAASAAAFQQQMASQWAGAWGGYQHPPPPSTSQPPPSSQHPPSPHQHLQQQQQQQSSRYVIQQQQELQQQQQMKVRPVSRGVPPPLPMTNANSTQQLLLDSRGSSPITAANERSKKVDTLMETLRVTFPTIQPDVLREYVNEFRLQLPAKTMKGMSVDQAVQGIVKLIMHKQALWKQQQQNVMTTQHQQLQQVHGQPSTGNNVHQHGLDTFAPHGMPNQGADICAICREGMRGQMSATLKCRHRFHAKCVTNWLSSQQTCPCCGKYNPSQEEYPELT